MNKYQLNKGITRDKAIQWQLEFGDHLKERVKKIKELLTLEGVEVKTGTIYNVDFGTNKQCRCEFYVIKKTKKITWNDIYKIVNSVKAVKYKFIEV